MHTATQVKAPSTNHSPPASFRQPAMVAPALQGSEAPVNDTQAETENRLSHSLRAISVFPPDPPVQPKRGNGLVSRLSTANAPSQAKPNAVAGLPASWRVRPVIQAKLTVGQPDDAYEQEADRVADRVMRMAEPRLQTKCACGGEAEADGECAACKAQRLAEQPSVQLKTEEGDDIVQTKSDADPVDATPELEGRLNSSRGSGSALPDETRTSMESAFGADFSGVRVHTGSDAIQMNRELSAQAFTHGSDIYFNAGKYDPGSVAGKGLLAHELTHVVQQGTRAESVAIVRRAVTRGAGGCGPRTEIDEDDDGARAAGRAAHRQIQAFLVPAIRSEVEIPRGTKRQKTNTECQTEGTNAGFADLLRMSGIVVDIGEIKPFPWAATFGVEDAEHYIRRSNQSMDRQFRFGVECPGMNAGTDDARFARTVHAGRLVPRRFDKLTGVLGGDTVIGSFDGDRSRTLKARLVAAGAVGYWCTGGGSDTYTCGVSQEETRAYIDRALIPAQEVLSKVIEEGIERPLARSLERLSVRQLLELGERHMAPQIRKALRPLLGPSVDLVLNQVTAQQLGDFIDQNLGPAAAAIATTLARRFASQVVNELRTRLRNALADMLRDTLASLCIGVPVVTLVQLLDALKEQLRRQARQLIPVVATAVALAMVAEVVEMIRQAVDDVANAILRVLAVVALVVLAVAIIVVGIIFLISLFDPVPGDEVAVGAAEAFLIQLLRSLAAFAFAAAESGAPSMMLAEGERKETTVEETTEGSVA